MGDSQLVICYVLPYSARCVMFKTYILICGYFHICCICWVTWLTHAIPCEPFPHYWPRQCPIWHNFCDYAVRDDVIKWKQFPRYWSFAKGIHRPPVVFPLKGQWRGASMFSLICARTNGLANNPDAVDFRRHRPRYNFIVMEISL